MGESELRNCIRNAQFDIEEITMKLRRMEEEYTGLMHFRDEVRMGEQEVEAQILRKRNFLGNTSEIRLRMPMAGKYYEKMEQTLGVEFQRNINRQFMELNDEIKQASYDVLREIQSEEQKIRQLQENIRYYENEMQRLEDFL